MTPEAVATSDQWVLSAQPWPHTQIIRLLMSLASDTGEACYQVAGDEIGSPVTIPAGRGRTVLTTHLALL